MNLVDQRCSNHALREAAVECPSCKRFFCRECVTEHQGRMICVSCVTGRVAAEPRARFRARWTIMAAAGIVLAWLLFYYLGLTLTRIPSEFHAEPESRLRRSLPVVAARNRPCVKSSVYRAATTGSDHVRLT
jgi:hypothetical protein